MNTSKTVDSVDVVVVGAGIQGAGIAQAAAAQGWSVTIVERREQVGAETSSNSSKLIHGGLRYLETLQFSLVYECLAERRRLLKNAPSLVRLRPFYIPVYKGSGRKPWWIFLGLTFYSLLGGLTKANRFHIIPKSKWSGLGIKQDGLSAVFQYFDAQTNDQVLTQAVIRSAESLGVNVLLNTEVVSGKVISDSSDSGYIVSLSNGEELKCKALVNAAGPWVNEVATRITSAPVTAFDWVQGSHIVLDIPELSSQLGDDLESCFYFESPVDRRAFFILPWEGKFMVGTTETPLSEPKAIITEGEIHYLLEGFNAFFPDYKCEKKDIVQTYSGIRVLPNDTKSDDPNKKSRETIFVESKEEGAYYVAVYGGKLTSYRATADKVVDRLNSVFGKQKAVVSTKLITLEL